MSSLLFSTGNAEKFDLARKICDPFGVTLVQKPLDIDEIQGEDSEAIIRDKVRKAFELTRQPVIVSDDSWNIPGLRGFPGPYMKSIEQWFTVEDFLNLTRPLTDRRIVLIQLLAYQDADQVYVVREEHLGALLTESRGQYGRALKKIVTMPGDNGLSIAEAYDRGLVHAERDVARGWRKLIKWYKQEALV